jgi:hypothetical protein
MCMHDSRTAFLFYRHVFMFCITFRYIFWKRERGTVVFVYTLLCLLPAWIQKQTTFGMFAMVIEHTHITWKYTNVNGHEVNLIAPYKLVCKNILHNFLIIKQQFRSWPVSIYGLRCNYQQLKKSKSISKRHLHFRLCRLFCTYKLQSQGPELSPCQPRYLDR